MKCKISFYLLEALHFDNFKTFLRVFFFQDGTQNWNQLFLKTATVLANQQFSKKNVSLEKNPNKTYFYYFLPALRKNMPLWCNSALSFIATLIQTYCTRRY